MASDKFLGIQKPRSIGEWIAVASFLGVLAMSYFSLAIAQSIVKHNEAHESHPPIRKEVLLIDARTRSQTELMKYVQEQNEREHRKILDAIQELKRQIERGGA